MSSKKQFMSLLLSAVLVTGIIGATTTKAEGLDNFSGKVNIGDYSLYTKIAGEKSKVSVVFDAGYGDGLHTYSMPDPNYETWGPVQSEVSKYAKTIAYDRAGSGLSDAGFNRPSMSDADIQTLVNGGTVAYDPSLFATGHGKTALDKAKDLHALLQATDTKAPYLLVIHSISMLTAVEFVKEYPGEVAGIVSVDGSWDTVVQDVVSWCKVYAPDVTQPFLDQFTAADGTLSEVLQSEQQVQHAGDVLKNIPFTILHPTDYGNGPEYQAMTNQAMQNWTTWSDKSKLIMVPNTSHYIMQDQPQVVIDAVEDMLKQLSN
jgi:pimeloyl-ACP methyl ester carboxylesterase